MRFGFLSLLALALIGTITACHIAETESGEIHCCVAVAGCRELLPTARRVSPPRSPRPRRNRRRRSPPLTTVIALQGLPCGEIVDVKVQAENDFAASCKDGNKYRVYLNGEGRWSSRSSQRKPDPLRCGATTCCIPCTSGKQSVHERLCSSGHRRGGLHSRGCRTVSTRSISRPRRTSAEQRDITGTATWARSIQLRFERPFQSGNVLQQIVDTRGHGQLLREPSGGE